MLTAPFTGFALGALFAWLSREDLVRGAPVMLAARSLVVVVAYALFVFGPATAYFLVFEPAWASAYLLDVGRHARAFDVLLAVLAPASVRDVDIDLVRCERGPELAPLAGRERDGRERQAGPRTVNGPQLGVARAAGKHALAGQEQIGMSRRRAARVKVAELR